MATDNSVRSAESTWLTLTLVDRFKYTREQITDMQCCLSSFVSGIEICSCVGQEFDYVCFVTESSMMNGSISIFVLKIHCTSLIRRTSEADITWPRSRDSHHVRLEDEWFRYVHSELLLVTACDQRRCHWPRPSKKTQWVGLLPSLILHRRDVVSVVLPLCVDHLKRSCVITVNLRSSVLPLADALTSSSWTSPVISASKSFFSMALSLSEEKRRRGDVPDVVDQRVEVVPVPWRADALIGIRQWPD